ncbi:MAG TPA: phage holin family protein [Candidatus Thermoplasmatota archaeon]|nr:phage holin family protein [Candidatus Thermoplasmatota archaeon]
MSRRIESAGARTEDATRRIAAAIGGALEGLVDALERYDLANEGRRAIENAGSVTRAAAGEAKTQAQTPEMQQLKHGIQTAGAKVSDVAHAVGTKASDAGHAVGDKASHVGHSVASTATGVRDGVTGKVSDLGHAVSDKVHGAADAVRHTAHDAKQGVHDAVESAKYAAHRAKAEVKVRADAVAESGRRAKLAPGHIAQELSEAFAVWKRALVVSIAMTLALVVFATIALIVLTIALVVGLNALIGDPAGTFVVALLYLVIGGIAFAVSRNAKAKAAREREERMQNVREEVRHVVRPVRDAFGRGRAY